MTLCLVTGDGYPEILIIREASDWLPGLTLASDWPLTLGIVVTSEGADNIS